MKKLLGLLLAGMLCCAAFASCGSAEQEPEPSVESSVEAEASPSPTPEPRTEVGIPEELKICDEPLYYLSLIHILNANLPGEHAQKFLPQALIQVPDGICLLYTSPDGRCLGACLLS